MSIRNAAAAVTVLLGLTVNGPVMGQDATARSAATPLKLNQFMKKPAKPVAHTGKVATASPQTKAAATSTVRRVASTATKKHAAATKRKHASGLAKVTPRPSRPANRPDPAQTTGMAPQESRADVIARADRVRVMSFNEINEIDLAADSVQVVEHDQLNELDVAADAKSTSNPAQDLLRTDDGAIATAAGPSEPVGSPWMQRILMALGGVLATVAAIRLWVG